MHRDPIWRHAAPGYLGVVREWGVHRLHVSQDGAYYRLQRGYPGAQVGIPEWQPVRWSSSDTLSRLLEKLAHRVEGLAEACEGLPEDPAQASPALMAARAAELDQLPPPFRPRAPSSS